MAEDKYMKARSIFNDMIKNKPLNENECQFLKSFVDQELEICRLKGEKQEKPYGEKNKKEQEKVHFTNGSHDERSEFDEKNSVSEGLQNLSISPEQNNNTVTREESEQVGNNSNTPCLSFHAEETESTLSERKYPNEPVIDYCKFVSRESSFLKLTREPLPFAAELKNEKIIYPIGVQYDEHRSEWYIADKKASKIIKINTSDEENKGVEIIESITLPQPSAVCILKDGKSIAILCQSRGFSIVEYFTTTDRSIVYCDHKNPIYDIRGNLRGLAKTVDGNLMVIEHGPKKHLKSLQVFKKDVGSARFPIQGAQNPCFIASNGTSVAISDLGSNSVYLYKLDDTNWRNICFEQLRVIKSDPMDVSQLCNESGFAFVAGLQFDISGNLLIGDAQGHTIKLYDQNLNFLHRLSTDFPMPYMSTFFVNKEGKAIILDIKSSFDKLIFAQLGNVSQVEQWNPSRLTRPNNGQYRPFRREQNF